MSNGNSLWFAAFVILAVLNAVLAVTTDSEAWRAVHTGTAVLDSLFAVYYTNHDF